ncbi:tRNA(Met) cytidine acetyltransferase TmcA [Erwinia sp. ErVv1]|uniref:tRNA(Met) cytidine acetyltransferase TmcA n=1 Tax=Erwinia sp. ErVv1 TaxID=1603299 RepID=UPI0009ECE8D2|nr:GNAT family N-acetyltransferase [Erwinia sp. ErVv1]
MTDRLTQETHCQLPPQKSGAPEQPGGALGQAAGLPQQDEALPLKTDGLTQQTEGLQRQTVALRCQGKRRLLVLSGTSAWAEAQAGEWINALPGDWLWLGDKPQSPLHCAFPALRTLLGREFLHAVFDARQGFHAEALAVLAGTLKAGSWLLMLVPPWQSWAALPDNDSLRWSERDLPVATPNFIRRLQGLIEQDKDVALIAQPNQPSPMPMPMALPVLHPDLPGDPDWPRAATPSQSSSFSPVPTESDWQPKHMLQQQRLLNRLLSSDPGIFVLIAPRGRGKSALAGQLAARWPGRCLVTAPGKVSTAVLEQFAGEQFAFIAPDRLLETPPDHLPAGIDWLLIDEAAAIPTPLLTRLVRLYPRVLLTTTLQGYEGTGRGFLLKFCATLPDATLLTLDEPLRWAADDPLERFTGDALLFADLIPEPGAGDVRYIFPEQADWQHNPSQLSAIYQLLASAHYRTSPLDLRRMMDAPGMHFSAALQGEQVQGALWLTDEGGLSETLSNAVWAGFRRPRGNLVAQSLAAHAGFAEAAQMRSRRISRIAIAPALRRQGVGREMVLRTLDKSAQLDFLSVSFGFTESLWAFWRACGFSLVRLGSQKEASSGCYSAMAMLPVSDRGKTLCTRAVQRLVCDWPWLKKRIDLPGLDFPVVADRRLNDDDWYELAGFAWAQRPLEACVGSLGRLLHHSVFDLALLHGAVEEGVEAAILCERYGLSGRKALLTGWRLEAQQALEALDAPRSQWLKATMTAIRDGASGVSTA